MAQNLNDEYRKFRYYEGVCSSSDFIKELAKVLSLGVKAKNSRSTLEEDEQLSDSSVITRLNWDIVYPSVNSEFISTDKHDPAIYSKLTSRDSYNDVMEKLTTEEKIAKLNNQISQIKNTVILKTETSPSVLTKINKDDLSVSEDNESETTTMYVQFYKPKYLANPEEYPLDAELQGLIPQVVTKEMYKEARKTTASVIYDLTTLRRSEKAMDGEDWIVDSSIREERVDAWSNALSYDRLFGKNGIKNAMTETVGVNIIAPDSSSKTTDFELTRANLNSIKQTNTDLYNFIFGICSLRATFTENDYDLIQRMRGHISYISSSTAEDPKYYISLEFNKNVEVFTIKLGSTIRIKDIYGFSGLENLKPELYSEGRYIPIPDKYLDVTKLSTDNITFSDDPENQLKFCLEHVVDDENSKILYGTLVLRFDYDKEINYTDLKSLKNMITDSVQLENNHYCLVRMFDNPNVDFSGPEPNIVDSKGSITTTNSHTSPWSKLSWYQDFEEIMVDSIDEDVSVTSITDGTLLVPLETAGLTSDTRISYWINTNNNRFTLVVMGNPALDYERDRHLISSCYIGRIDSFEHSVNDISGNFALYTSSSTTPCKTVMTAHDTQYHINRDFKNEMFVDGAESKSEYLLCNIDSTKYPDAINKEGNINAYITYCRNIGGELECTTKEDKQVSGFSVYYITITGNKFFNENETPRYMIIDPSGKPVVLKQETGEVYRNVSYLQWIRGTSDSRSNQVALYVPNNSNYTDKYKIYFNFGYFEEKFVIESGITRDLFGNVIGIETNDEYGKNTSDGITSVSMFHTRSKAFYQKHHFLFATTEEYMSKVMYGKSSYTGEYYADRIKITHGNDGPRGILCDTLVIDSSSLYPKDELVINKDFEKNPNDLEETFTYFPITAPFSPLSDGPNARYGLAIKKAEREPNYTDNKKLINIAKSELDTIMEDYAVLDKDIFLPEKTEKGCKIYWSVDPSENWMEDSENGNKITRIFNGKERNYVGVSYEANNVEVCVKGFEGFVDDDTEFNEAKHLRGKTFELNNTNCERTINFKSSINVVAEADYEDVPQIIYGYSDEKITRLNKDTSINKVIDDGTATDDDGNIHIYPYIECVTDSNHIINDHDKTVRNIKMNLYNAHPAKYLNVFFVDDISETVEEETVIKKNVIKDFASLPLHYDTSTSGYEIAEYKNGTLVNGNGYGENCIAGHALFDLLQYPCTINAFVNGIDNQGSEGIFKNNLISSKCEYDYVEYNKGHKDGEGSDVPKNHEIVLKNMGANAKAIIKAEHYVFKPGDSNYANWTITSDNGKILIPGDQIVDDLFVSISKK